MPVIPRLVRTDRRMLWLSGSKAAHRSSRIREFGKKGRVCVILTGWNKPWTNRHEMDR